MASEIIHIADYLSNLTGGLYLDRRGSMVSGTVFSAAAWSNSSTTPATNIAVDDAEQVVNPVASSVPWSGQHAGLVALNTNGQLHFTFDNTAVQGLVLLARGDIAATINVQVDGSTVDSAFAVPGSGVADFDRKTPVWGYKNGTGGVTLTPGTHTVDIQQAATGNLYMYAVCGYDAAVHPRRVLLIGDSFITYQRNWAWHFRNLLKLHFPESDLKLYSFAQSGRTTADLLSASIHGLTQLDLMLMAYSPTLVISCLGRNDQSATTNGVYDLSTSSTANITNYWSAARQTEMNTVLTRVKASGAQLAWHNPATLGYNQSDYIMGAREWAAANGVPFRDGGLTVGPNTNLISSNHPDSAANELMGMDMFLWFIDTYRWLI
jgi:lysophospholipase L1-like esterase